VICCDAPVPRRLLTTVLGVLVAALLVLAGGFPAHAFTKPQRPPACPPVTVKNSTKAAMAVFSGTVTEVVKQDRTDGLPGALYVQTVTVGTVYQGEITTEEVEVQTDRNRADCSLGALAVNTEYMFFVTGTGEPWVATGTSGTRVNNETVTAQVERLLGEGEPPVQPTPEQAEFTPVDTSEPKSLGRAAAPGLALVLVGLLGLVVVGAVRRRA
jgi:hypothetical protein